ncbi:PKD domain-containing protein [Hirschia maritima]|uniref:PKD domain-containing protein n=1 Tax=Hirschia maritima TaxID=1121961 RepID=UPI00035C1F36|nr:hypothetical protein [Hirschia maritima]
MKLGILVGTCSIVLILSACSGGGGSGPTTSATPTSVANRAPVAVISAPLTTVDELQMISLSAEGSSDADRDTLSYSWVQSSGPDLAIGAQTGVQFNVQVPELAADENYTFELTVSDGEASAKQTIDVIGRNIVLGPLASEWSSQTGGYQTQGKIVPPFWSYENRYFLTSVYSEASEMKPAKYTEFYFEHNGTGNYDYSLSYDHDANLEQPFQPPVNFRANSTIWRDFYQYIESSNTIEVRVYPNLDVPQVLSLPSKACALFHTDYAGGFDPVRNTHSARVLPNILVALEDGGILEFENLGNRNLTAAGIPDVDHFENWGVYSETATVFKNDGTYCSGNLSNWVIVDDTSIPHQIDKQFVLFNEDNQSLELITASNTSIVESAEPYQQIDLSELSDEKLYAIPLVQGSIYDAKNNAREFVAVGLTNGIHSGDHFVLLINPDFDAFKSMRLPNGVPSDIYAFKHQDSLVPSNEKSSDIFVVSPDSPYVVYFENNVERISPFEFEEATSFKEAQYIDIGFGGKYLNFEPVDVFGVNDDMYVAYAEEGRVASFGHSATNNP